VPGSSEPIRQGVSRCPECGWAPGQRAVAPRGLRHWTCWIPSGVFLLALVGCSAWFALDNRTLPIGSGLLNEVVVEPLFNAADLEAIANSEDKGAALALTKAIASAVPDWAGAGWEAPGSQAVEVAFFTWGGPRRRSWCFGWPSPWLCRHETRHYANNITREGFMPARTDPAWETAPSNGATVPIRPVWSVSHGRLFYQPAPERTAGVDKSWMFNPAALAILIATATAGGVLAACCARLVGALRSSRAGLRTRRRGAIVGAVLGIALLLALALAGARTEEHRVWAPASHHGYSGGPGLEYWVRQDFFRLPWRRSELLVRADEAELGAEVARTILANVPVESRTGSYLAVGVDNESVPDGGQVVLVPGSVPIVQFEKTRYTRRSDFGPPEPMTLPKGVTLHRDAGFVSALWSTGDPKEPSLAVRMHADWVVLLVVVLVASWWLPRRGCLSIWRHRGRSRFSRGVCPQCAYEIGSVLP